MGQNSSIMLSTKYKLALVFFALLGVILVFLSTSRYGAGLSPDSVGYISIARNLITGAGFTSYDGSPLIVQPPLFPKPKTQHLITVAPNPKLPSNHAI